MMPEETQFWRVTNSTADTILDLQVLYDGVPQTLQIVGLTQYRSIPRMVPSR